MRYKVFFGQGDQDYAICYGANVDEAKKHFGDYHPNTAITKALPYPDAMEPENFTDLMTLTGEVEAEEALRYLIEAIEDAGVEHRVAGYLYRFGFGREEEYDE